MSIGTNTAAKLEEHSQTLPGERSNIEDRLPRAIDRAKEHLFSLQDEEGYWWAELEANTTLTSEYVYLMHMLGRVNPERERQCINELFAEQRPDGGWWINEGGESDISTSVEAYVALKMMGVDTEDERMVKAREFILNNGGVESARVFTKIHFAFMGLWDYRGTPVLPPWVMMLPKKFFMSIYQMSSWARSCVVPLAILLDKKPIWKPEREMDIDELYAGGKENVDHNWPLTRKFLSWNNFFIVIDHILRFLDNRGLVPFRERSIRAAEKWVLEHQDDEGDWGGIIPAMAYSLLALQALGYEREHPSMRKGWEAIERFGMDRGDKFRLQSCVGPVWDTALAMWALQDAGVSGKDDRLKKGSQWLLSKQIQHYGDWAVKNDKGRPGGWSFEFFNRFYPDCDDSSAVMLAIKNVDLGAENDYRDATIDRAREWVVSMQCKDGGWGAFDIDNNQHLWNEIPFADLKAMLDPNTPDLTGRVVEMLGESGRDCSDPVVARAVDYLLREQEEDGSWYGRWGVNYIYGTWAVLCGLRKVGIGADHPAIKRGVAFLESVQNKDGGWGEACESYDIKRFMPYKSSPSQTAWAVMGLVAAGRADSIAVARGVRWLLDRQETDGHWEEEHFTGTGFPSHFYIRYHLYRDCFPTMALGHYSKALRGNR